MQFRQAKAQAPAIQRLLKDENKEVRGMAVRTLGRLGCKKAAASLLEVLRHEGDDKDMRYYLVVALAQVGEAQAALKLAKEDLSQDEWSLRFSAIAALKCMDFQVAGPMLMEGLLLEFKRAVKGEGANSHDQLYLEICALLE